MCAVLLAVGKDNEKFVGFGCINIVVAANAGGAFSPFGDITTLMVWQEGLVNFSTFFLLFIPSVVNFVVPASIMQFAITSGKPACNVCRTFHEPGHGTGSLAAGDPDRRCGWQHAIGSAAGVALMGQARGKYTFFGHLKWTPVIILGYATSIMVHLWVNADTFTIPVTPG